VDRTALAALELPRVAADELVVPPRTSFERSLSEIWKDLLGIDVVDAQRSFFEHGGTSLQLVRLQYRIRVDLGIGLTVADLFAHPTVEALARRIEARVARKSALSSVTASSAALHEGDASHEDARSIELLPSEDVRSILLQKFAELRDDG